MFIGLKPRSEWAAMDAVLEQLRRKVRDGWQLLKDSPFSKKAHRRHQRELNELLEECITHRHPLFREHSRSRKRTLMPMDSLADALSVTTGTDMVFRNEEVSIPMHAGNV